MFAGVKQSFSVLVSPRLTNSSITGEYQPDLAEFHLQWITYRWNVQTLPDIRQNISLLLLWKTYLKMLTITNHWFCDHWSLSVRLSVCLSVRPSVTLMYRGRMCWVSSNYYVSSFCFCFVGLCIVSCNILIHNGQPVHWAVGLLWQPSVIVAIV